VRFKKKLEIPNSTLSHHLDKLRSAELVAVRRKGTFLRYIANTEALQELLQFLYAGCGTRNQALQTAEHHTNLQIGAIMGTTEAVDIKEVVKQKYGEAALGVHSGGSWCGGGKRGTGCADPITTNLYDATQLGRSHRRPCWLRLAAEIPLLSPN